MHLLIAFVLAAGPQPAGYRTEGALTIWYPAQSPGKPLTYRDYAPDAGAFAQVVGNLSVNADDRGSVRVDGTAVAEKILASPVLATRDAPPAGGRFPVVILGSDGLELIGEHLATRGFLVVGLRRGRFPQTTPADVERQADEVLGLWASARKLASAGDRVAYLAFSASTLAGVVAEARGAGFAARVSLDGWDGSPAGRRVLAQVPGIEPRSLRASWFLAQLADDPTLRIDTSLFRAAGLAERRRARYPGTHFDFLPLRAAAGFGDGTTLTAALRDVDAFLDATLVRGTVPPPTAETLAAAPPVPGAAEIRAKVAAGEGVAAAALLRAAAQLPEDIQPLAEAEVNGMGYDLLAQRKLDDAVAVFGANAALHPRSVNVHDSLGEALAARGDKDAAIASYRRALEIDAHFPSATRAIAALNGQVSPAGPPSDRLFYKAPGAGHAQVTRNVRYQDDRTLDVYRPAGKTGKLPVVIFVNGVVPELKDWPIYRDWADAVAATGMAAVVYQARSNRVEDSEALLGYLAEHGRELGIDSDRMCLWAASANGAVATRVNAVPRKGVRCLVYYYAGTDLAPRADVPILVARAGRDPFINVALDAFIAEALTAGTPLEVVNYQEGHHAFDCRDDTAESRRIVAATLAYLKRHLE